MNTYIVILSISILIIAGGILYRNFILSEGDLPVETGVIREFTIIAEKNKWAFKPEEIEIDRGDKVVLTIINEDAYDHGFAIDALGISQRMPANSTIKVDFIASQLGDFQYYCSVPCGEGDTDRGHRTHFDMIGTLRVRNIVSTSTTLQ